MNNVIWSIAHTLFVDNILKAENGFIYDSKGNKYLDMESGVWCTSIGHCHPRVNKTIKEQVDKIYQSGFNYISPVVDIAARKVLEISNLIGGKCAFLCSGSEAIEFGIRVVNTISIKPTYLTFSDSYFGAYGEASQKEHPHWIRYNWLDCSCKSSEGCSGECEDFAEIPFVDIGLFLFEPGSSSGLVRFPSKQLISKIAAKVKENGGYLMMNEVTTGIGRTGKWFGFQHYGIEPDIIAMGKGIGNGYPVSVTAISQQVAKRFEQSNFHYAQSHQNDPLGAAVVKVVIETIEEEKLICRCLAYGHKIISYLNELRKIHPIIKDVRGRGLMIAIELVEKAEYIQRELFKRGILIAKRPNKEVLRLDPPLTITREDVEMFLILFEEVLMKAQENC